MRRTLLVAAIVLAAGCGPDDREAVLRSMRHTSTTYQLEVTPDVQPPRAREPIMYRIVVRDRRTRQPIENGEGRIFANNREGARTWDGLTYGPELGTYYGRLSYTIDGEWAVAVQFRRDSLYPLERIDWMQWVAPEQPLPRPPTPNDP